MNLEKRMLPGRHWSKGLFVTLLFVSLSTVDANVFSRLLKVENKKVEDKSQAPSGVAAATGSEAKVGSVVSFEDGVMKAHLSNNNQLPLVGVGVGNSKASFVGAIVADAIQDDKKTRLIDTSHASHNEELVAEGILAGVATIKENRNEDRKEEKIEVHVITKVWYTHLGYDRTKLAVEESLKAFKDVQENESIDFKLHVLLHWPRCFDHIPWMNCKQEESDLPDYVRGAGPDPSGEADAWKESWRLLEDMYLSDNYHITSIGVSNFHLTDLQALDNFARIHPHVLQVNVWSLLYDAHLVDYCHKHRIHVQVYNTMQGTISKADAAPRAFHHIQKVAYELGDEIGYDITPAQVIMAWLIQHGVSVIPRTSRLARLEENSAIALVQVPAMDDHQVEAVAHSVEAYLSGDDLEHDIHVSVSFHAVNKDIMLYWHGEDGSEVRIAHVKQGEVFNETTYPNHVFRTYDASNKDVFIEHQIRANFGEHKEFRVEL